ncbi:hypothetical protein V490_06593 [Pseudogymnoascus sp. VKM F-3557]|nr:hypothetical protein V490_06593 [Pseudogymnoascus sp. VKM F-3557]
MPVVRPFIRPAAVFLAICSILFVVSMYHSEPSFVQEVIFPEEIALEKGVDINQKEQFVQAILDNEIDGNFDPKAFRKVCSSKKWNEQLIFVCGAPQGGLGNIRNVFLTCVRYAIEAGAAFVVPEFIPRDTEDISLLNSQKLVPFTHFFNQTQFIHNMREGCPEMKMHTTIPPTIKDNLIPLQPQSLLKEVFAGTVLLHAEQWRPAFDKWLAERPTKGNLVAVELATPLLNFPLKYDTQAFTDNFGRILQFTYPQRRLAATVLWALRTKFNVPVGPWKITPSAFFGAHLRVAADAKKAGWTGYDVQSKFLLETAETAGLSTVYVTSESDLAATFKKDAKKKNIMVTMKEELLEGKDLEELNKMTWDQRGLVDYEVLLRSSMFAGIELSSFTWNIALRRHTLSRQGYRDAWDTNVKDGEKLSMKDEYSWVFGQKHGRELFVESMWP